jgi:hypothetical protein
MKAYKSGTIKVVWLGDETNVIHSQMFESEKEANDFGKKHGDFIIFRLQRQLDMKHFTWQVLPYGQYLLYRKVVDFYKRHHNKAALFQLVEIVL